MLQSAITSAIRVQIKEPTPKRLTDTQIEAVVLRGVPMLGLKIKEKDPTYYNERVSLTSNSNVFSFPTGCKTIAKVWDYSGRAISITGAANNGSGLVRITAASHSFADGAIVRIHDVAGCTEANGAWKIDYVTADTFDLLGSTFANAYTSGGKVFQEKTDMVEIVRINMADQSNNNDYAYFLRKRQIIIDDVSYDSDIIIDYEGAASVLADIPDEYHEYLISWGVVNLMELKPEEKDYEEKVKNLNFHKAMMMNVLNDIGRSFTSNSEPNHIRNVWND